MTIAARPQTVLFVVSQADNNPFIHLASPADQWPLTANGKVLGCGSGSDGQNKSGINNKAMVSSWDRRFGDLPDHGFIDFQM